MYSTIAEVGMFSKGSGFFRGRVALASILEAFGLRPGDSVAVQAFTCSALAEALAYCQLRPQWIDIRPSDYTMDADDLAKKADMNTKAVIVQHTYGFPSDMDAISAICAERNLPIIEDCCHTLSSRWRGQEVGSIGDAAFYSFESGKPLVVGLGGWGVVNNERFKQSFHALAESCEAPPTTQQVKIRGMYEAFRLLYTPRRFWTLKRTYRRLRDLGILASNYKADGLNAPLFDSKEFKWRMGALQLNVLRKIAGKSAHGDERRRQIADQYTYGLADGRFGLPTWDWSRADPVLIRYPIRVRDKDWYLQQLEQASVEASDNYSTPVHPYTGAMLARAGYAIGSCPQAEKAAREVIALSCAPGQSEAAVARTIEIVRRLAA